MGYQAILAGYRKSVDAPSVDWTLKMNRRGASTPVQNPLPPKSSVPGAVYQVLETRVVPEPSQVDRVISDMNAKYLIGKMRF
tara:strand:- start:518 stop:763 length:246 start_codon:yes stop_codon:yes gene_type:complete